MRRLYKNLQLKQLRILIKKKKSEVRVDASLDGLSLIFTQYKEGKVTKKIIVKFDSRSLNNTENTTASY